MKPNSEHAETIIATVVHCWQTIAKLEDEASIIQAIGSLLINIFTLGLKFPTEAERDNCLQQMFQQVWEALHDEELYERLREADPVRTIQ